MRITTLAALLVSFLLQAGCAEETSAPAAAPASSAAFDTSITTKQLMSWITDPSAKIVFAAVATIVTEEGEEQIQPRTDEEWNRIRNHAAMVLESGNLLMLQGRDKKLKAEDWPDWVEKSRALSAAARAAIEATEVKDPEALFLASGDIYQTCTDCHEKYIFTQPMPGGGEQ
jgi:hypothetical protein